MSKFEQSFERALAATKVKRSSIAKAVRTASGVLVGRTPVRDPEELALLPTISGFDVWSQAGHGPGFGELKFQTTSARLWLNKKKVVTVQHWSDSGGWITTARYRT